MPVTLSQKSVATPFICKLFYSTLPGSTPAVNSDAFGDTLLLEGASKNIYASLSAIDFAQSGERSRAGMSYSQKLRFQFPNGDAQMAMRLDEITKLRYVIIELTDGGRLVMGRNDYYQNTAPAIKIENNTRTTQVTVESSSIFPLGRFSEGYVSITGNLLPHLYPIGL